tara:strand:+ start:1002 stop:1190 length:189 start_codon:yes stop_codon:yes gene_type:complete
MKVVEKLCPNCGTTDPELFSDKSKKNTRCITCNQSTNENEIYREAGRKESLINKFMKARIND